MMAIPATKPMDEYELEEIKREIVESRALTIKTNNLVNALAADVKSISKRQQGSERRIVINTATAYVVTIAVLLFFVKLAWDLRLESIRTESKEAREKLEQFEKEIKHAQVREEATRRASRRAAEFYQLIQDNKRREIVDTYTSVANLELTPTEQAVFESAKERAKNELSLLAYQSGLDHARTGRYHEAQQAFRESLKYKSDAAHSPNTTLELGKALNALNLQREAIPLLLQLSETSADKDIAHDATLELGRAELALQAWNDAKNTLRTFIRRFPNSSHFNEAKTKLADIQQR